MPKLDHVNHENLTIELVGDELRLKAEAGVGEGIPDGGTTGQVLKKASGDDYDTEWGTEAASIIELVSGGAGFVEVGAGSTVGADVTLDLDTGRAFSHRMVGNITSLSFLNVPPHGQYAPKWRWALWIDSTGGYTLAGTPTVTWVGGGSWGDLDLTAGAINIVEFTTVGTVTYAALIWNGSLDLDPYKVCFLENATIVILTEDEDIDVPSVTQNGDGVITFERNGGSITTVTSFSEGDRLSVICSGATGTTTVRVPRSLP